ncbi:MAG: hypothetical protein OEZ16_11215 [Chromatiales bacterium]|nr:hypothetical protein [Chromatiales bacterium]
MKQLLARLLAFVVAFNCVFPAYGMGGRAVEAGDEASLRAHYPNARFIHVTAEEYPQLAERLRSEGYRPDIDESTLRLAQSGDVVTGYEGASRESQSRSRNRECDSSSGSQGESSVRLDLDLHGGSGSGGSSSGEEAAVLFVIVGAIVLVVWTLYLFKYLYDLSLGYHPCRWSELAIITTAISSDTEQHAYFNGVSFKTGIRDGGSEFGIMAEIGRSDIYLVDNGTLHLKGNYWLLGPTLRWHLSHGSNPHYLEMGFAGGSTEHDEMGVIARADIGLRFGVGESLNFGFNWGALNLQLNGGESVITEQEQFHYQYGFSMGYRF